MKAKLFFSIPVLVILMASGCSKSEEKTQAVETAAKYASKPRELRLSMPAPMGTAVYASAEGVKKYIEENTGGQLTVTLFPANQLGEWTVVFDEIMMGSIDMAITPSPETYDPVFKAVTLPYIAYSYKDIRKLLAPDSVLTKSTAEAQEKLGIKFFGFSMNGFDGVGTMKELKNSKDSGKPKDCLIRVPSVTSVKLALERLGFLTASIPFVDVYSSLQTGVIQGWIGAPPFEHYLNFRDVEKYYYEYNILVEVSHVIMSMKTWDSLTPEQQMVVEAAMAECSRISVDDAEKDDVSFMQKLDSSNVKVIRFSEEELAAFAKDMRANIWPQFETEIGSEFMKTLIASME
jgi:TRAP-type C4-dicarboxylate transport system substrate-binding protein